MTKKEITLEQLENITGGTASEYTQLVQALDNNGGSLSSVSSGLPGLNAISASSTERLLERKHGIKADISVGMFGTGFGERANTYTDLATGRRMSHLEVLARLQTGG